MTNRERRDPYVVLGVRRQATADEIARAYRRAARATHPDSSGESVSSGEEFSAVSDAYELLRDSRRRADYDRLHPSAPPRPPRALAGSVRYAGPGSHHIVLGERPSSPVRRTPLLGDGHVAGPAGDAEALHLALRLLLDG